MTNKNFLAVDLGATSGRVILGTVADCKIELKELIRFPNQILQIHNHFYWNIYSLYENIKLGLFRARNEGVKISSLGIDTWGVDFVLIGKDGSLIGAPLAYRDPHTQGKPEEFFKIIPKEKVYQLTGIQVMEFNSLYQLYALKQSQSSFLEAASEMLFMPDALAYLLTGKKIVEYTIASTSQILNPHNKKFNIELLQAAGVTPSILSTIVMPGNIIGTLTDAISKECHIDKIPVVAVAGHDTASAIAAIPAENENFAYLSSGTWSLMGIELKDPIITQESYYLNFTNEGGIDGSICFLKNITGMWLLEQCLKEWKKEECNYSYEELAQMALSATPFCSLIDVDHPSFSNPLSMTIAISEYCVATDQVIPLTHADYVRCIFESLGMKYKCVLDKLKEFAPFHIDRLHVIGGGSKNEQLNQWTADAIGLPVIAGPSEATAIGNIMIQAKTASCFQSLQEMRKVIIDSVPIKEFTPNNTLEWEISYKKYLNIIQRNSVK